MKSLPRRLIPLILFILLALVAFRAAWPKDQVIHAMDFNVGLVAAYKSVFPSDWFSGTWSPGIGLGSVGSRSINLTNLLITLFPVEFTCDWIYAIHLVIASLAFTAFLRRQGVGLAAALFGALTAFWLASNLTLIHPGHLYKYGVISCCALFLWLWEKGLATSRPGWFVLAGGAFGLMFLEQQDLALFCAVLAGPHALWRLWSALRAGGGLTLRAALPAVAAGVTALLFMSDAYFKAKKNYIDPVAITQKTNADNWGWATQWSWPLAETIDFVAPGYHGLRNGEPGAEYWGEMGQSPEFKATGQGFRNFKLESQYLGVIPVGFALFAVVLACRRATRGAPARGLLIFWSAATLVLFLLACGKYLPFYRLFYEIPLMSSIRNPNKFLQVFQLGLGVLAALGFDAALGAERRRFGLAERPARDWMVWSATGAAVLMLLGWMAVQSSTAALTQELAVQRYEDAARLAAGASSAMAHGFLMAAAFAGLLWASRSAWGASPKGRAALPGLAIALVVADVLMLASQFLLPQHIGTIRGNLVGAWLKREAAGHRVTALDQSGIYGHLLTFVFPYEGVHFTNMLAAPRVLSDMDRYYKAVGPNLLRQWTHFGVSHVLMSASKWEQARRVPAFAAALEPALGWGLVQDPVTGFRVVEMRDKPQHLVLRLKGTPGHAWLAGAWKEASAEETFKAVANPAEEMISVAWVEPDPAAGALPPSGAPGLAGKVTTTRKRNSVEMRVEAERPAILVMSEHFGREFEATVNGQPAPLRRVNGVLMGLTVPAGNADVVVRYAMPQAGVRVIQAALVLCLLGGVSLLIPGRRSPAPAA